MWLQSLAKSTEGDPIRFELVSGEVAAGRIGHLERKQGEVSYISGELNQPEAGRFFFQKQSRPGVAGDFVGVVELPASKLAYRLEPTGPGGSVESVERRLDEVLCLNLPRPRESALTPDTPPLNPGDFPNLPIPPYQNGIVVLESLHGATPVIYLDFQGGYTRTWGGVTYQRPAVSNDQIREVWRRVAEDFLPFNLNVTTDLRVFQNAPEGSRQRVIITPTTIPSPEAGGIAYVGSFNWTGDTPCWVFLTSGKACAEACSHEVGHTLGLGKHDGQSHGGTTLEY